jgi:hypothetical protein
MGLWYNYDAYKSLDEGVHEENVFTHFGKLDSCPYTVAAGCITILPEFPMP